MFGWSSAASRRGSWSSSSASPRLAVRDLDRDLLVDPGVAGEEDGAEAAGAEVREDLILADRLSQQEHEGAAEYSRSVAAPGGAGWLHSPRRRAACVESRVREGAPMSFMEDVYAKVKGKGARVVYPEGLEERAIRAARLAARPRARASRC